MQVLGHDTEVWSLYKMALPVKAKHAACTYLYVPAMYVGKISRRKKNRMKMKIHFRNMKKSLRTNPSMLLQVQALLA